MVYSVTPAAIPKERVVRALLSVLIIWCSLVQAGESVVATDTWMRAMPPGQQMSAAYTTLENRSKDARAVMSVSSSAARAVEIHISSQQDGTWRMQALEQLPLPAGEKVVLAPGAVHLMVMGLADSPRVGDKIPFELVLDNGDVIKTVADVRPIGASTHKH